MKRAILLLFISLVFTAPSFAQLTKTVSTAELDTYFKKALKEWNVPGMAIAIIKDNKVVLSKGYGFREVGKKDSVDENTLFAIASISKTFTASALSILVDEGKISLDDKVTKYLPYFELYDPYVTSEMKIRDLLCHRTGLATFSGDLLWYGTSYTRDEVIRRAKYLKPTYGFREEFGYSNIMFLTAGQIIPVVTGKSWDDYLKEKFFFPLSMTNTITSTTDIKDKKNVSLPHTESDGKIISIPYLNWDNIAPAGSIISSVKDLSQWIKLQLNYGTLEGKKFFSEEASFNMWQPQTVLNVSKSSQKLWPSTHFKSYGLGWSISDYCGRKIVGHNGGYDGMVSQMILVPEENLGFVILTNCNSGLYFPLMYKILDSYLNSDKDLTDWSAKFLQFDKMRKQDEADKRAKEKDSRNKKTKPSLELKSYTGTYSGDLYGSSEVTIDGKTLNLQFTPAQKFKGELTHWQFDTFQIIFKEFPSLPSGTVNFILDAKGEVEEMRVNVPNPDFDFTELKFMKVK
jgi:CubicO group peptidase (beta-lactamase class C family)